MNARKNQFARLVRQYNKYLRRLTRLGNGPHIQTRGRKARILLKRLQRLSRLLPPGAVRANVGAMAVCIGIAISTAPLAAQVPRISELSPAANAHGVARDAEIGIRYSTLMNPASLSGDSIRIFGSQSGFLSTSGTFSGNPALRFNPGNDFHPGEHIMVTVSGGRSTSGTLMTTATVYAFRAAAHGGAAQFTHTTFGGLESPSTDVALGDLDGDGDLDAVVANYRIGDIAQAQEIWLNNGDATFSSTTTGAGRSTAVALGDLDGDGDLDAILCNNLDAANEIWLNNGNATFTSSSFGNGGSFDVALGDLDGDGDLDAVIARAFNLPGEIWLNNGDATFSSSQYGANRISMGVALGDLDGDGDLDAIIANYAGQAQEIWLNNGDATFSSFDGDNRNSTAVALGDLDGDGDLDAVMSNRSNQPQKLWLNNGDAGFVRSSFGGGWSEDVAFGDVDGDGDLDILIANYAFATSNLWLNNGDATFYSASLSYAKAKAAALGDLDGDGDLDAVIAIDKGPQNIFLNLPQAPTITNIHPNCIIAGPGGLDLYVEGTNFEATTAQLSVLDADANPAGTIDLQLSSSSATFLTAHIPPGFAATAGTVQLTLHNPTASTSASLVINAPVAVAGPTCGCPDALVQYAALPTSANATHVWSVQGGTIIDGQGTGNVQVVWRQGAAVSLSVERTYPGACTTAATLPVAAKTLTLPGIDYARTSAGTSLTLAVLHNDGAGFSLSALENPAHGTAFFSGGNVTYVAESSFSGIERFRYTAADTNGCRVSGTIVVAVASTAAHAANPAYVERHNNNQAGVQGLAHAVDVAVAPDGRHVYAAGQFDNAIALFARDSAAGTLAYVERVRNGAGGVQGLSLVSAIALSPDGRHLYAAGYGNNAVAVFSRDEQSGILTYIEKLQHNKSQGANTISGLKRVIDLALSPDGRNVYAVAYKSHSVAVFERNPFTGELRWLEYHKDGVAGVNGMNKARAVVVSPDGAGVYVAAYGDNAVAVFDRDLHSGRLSYREYHKDGLNGVDGLNGACAVALSPDRRTLYAAGCNDHAVAVFTRDTANGSLSYAARYKDGSGGIDGLYGASDVALSADGSALYALGYLDNALAMFRPEPGTPVLHYEHNLRDGSGGADGLSGPRALHVDAESRHVYVAAYGASAVSVFMRNLAPRAVHDTASLYPNSVVVIPVLGNDADPNMDSLSISGISDGTLGTVTISPDAGALHYNAGALAGPDSLRYTVADGRGGSSTATVSITVAHAKQAAPGFTAESCRICRLEISPNPMRGNAVFHLSLAESASVRLRLLDALGRERALVYCGNLAQGEHSFPWVANETALPAGEYFAVLEALYANGVVQREALALILLR